MTDVTRILSQIESGDPSAAEQLLPLVYDELQNLAAPKLAHEPGQMLEATPMVHEAYFRLVQVGNSRKWDSQGHLLRRRKPAQRKRTLSGPVIDSPNCCVVEPC